MAVKTVVVRRTRRWLKFGCVAMALLTIVMAIAILALSAAFFQAAAMQTGCGNSGVAMGPGVAAAAMQKAGITGRDQLIVMTAIAGAESGWDPSALDANGASGLWKIKQAEYPAGFPPAKPTGWLTDANNNALAAVAVAGGPTLTNLQPWSADSAYSAFAVAGGVTTTNGVTTIDWTVASKVNDIEGVFGQSLAAVDALLSGGPPVATPTPLPNMTCCGAGTSGGSSGNGGLSAVQLAHVRVIIGVAKARNIPIYGQIIAVATARQESNFLNYANGKIPETLALPHDAVGWDGYSAGIFQQQTGPFGTSWGTPAQVMDPAYASSAFFDRMLNVPNWQTLPLTVVAQAVQRSAFPNAYAQWQAMATQLVNNNQDAPPIVTGGPPFTGNGGCQPVSGYINPIQPGKWGPARSDQGVDWLPLQRDTPVLAIGNGVINYSHQNGTGWPNWQCGTCGAYMTYKLTDGPKAGYYIYVSENLTSLLPQGTVITAGETIALAQPGYAWTEWGYARPAPMGSYGGPAANTGGCNPNCPTPGGWAFTRFLTELGAHTLMTAPPGPDVPY